MSLLSSSQRAVVVADTGIHPLIVDRSTEAFDALVSRGDVEAYKRLMGTAHAQMGFGDTRIRREDRPTALDKMKTILIHAYADQKHISYRRAAALLKRMLKG